MERWAGAAEEPVEENANRTAAGSQRQVDAFGGAEARHGCGDRVRPLAIAFAVLAAKRPSFAIGGLLVVDPFAFYHYVGPTTLTLPKAALIGFVVGLAMRRVTLRPIVGQTPRALLEGLCAIVATTALSGIDAYFVAPYIRELLKAVSYLVLFVAAFVGFAADPEEEPIWWALVTVTAVVSVMALGEEFGGAHSYVAIGGRAVVRIAGPARGP